MIVIIIHFATEVVLFCVKTGLKRTEEKCNVDITVISPFSSIEYLITVGE